jgi:ribosomal protein S12 methylthiotransferase
MARLLGLVSLGCAKNLVDSEVIAGALAGNGWSLTTALDEAEAILINTCAFIEDARKESVEAILEVASLKGRTLCKVLVVAGCLPQRYGEELLREVPEVDAVVGIEDFPRIGELLEEIQSCATKGRQTRKAWIDAPHEERVAGSGMARFRLTAAHTAYLKIAEGCDHPCTFCIIPDIRGSFRSRPIGDVVAEAEALVETGAVELVLVAQDTTAYGADRRAGERLPHLLRRLCALDGLKWVRLLYAYPTKVGEDLLQLMVREEKIVPYLDVPIQHINDRILSAMKRAGTRSTIESMIGRVRSSLPGSTLRTTVLVGFPGETESEFQELLDFIRQAAFDRLGAFAFSLEEGSPAADMQGQLPQAEKEARLEEVMKVQAEVVARNQEAMVRRRVEVLYDAFDPEDPAGMLARTEGMAPEVDGVVRVSEAEASPGEFGWVTITGATDYDLLAEPSAS